MKKKRKVIHKAITVEKRTTPRAIKKTPSVNTKKILEPIEEMIQKLNFKPISFEVGNSGKCFYCADSLPNCGCVILEIRYELRQLSPDFNGFERRGVKGWLSSRVNSYIVFNLKMWPKDGVNILAYNVWDNRLLYKRYGEDGILWPASSGFGATSEGRWDEHTEILGVELDVVYNGISVTGETYGAADLCRDSNYIPPKRLLPKLTRRAYELVCP